MANHDVSNPIFDKDLRKFETSDPGHADVFNAVAEQLINNDVAIDAHLNDKMSLYIGETLPEVSKRDAKTLYLKVTDIISTGTTSNLKVSPNMGLKIEE